MITDAQLIEIAQPTAGQSEKSHFQLVSDFFLSLSHYDIINQRPIYIGQLSASDEQEHPNKDKQIPLMTPYIGAL